MPRIPPAMLDSIVYLYPSVDEARAGKNFGGSGFLLFWEFAGTEFGLVYVITNWHVACQGSPVVRVNTVDGDNDIFDFDEVEWVFDPKYDIAIHPIKLIKGFHRFCFMGIDGLVTQGTVIERKIGPGDDVFMIGRFLDHDGGKGNIPAVRFGNISIDPTPITQPSGAKAESYCLDMHSRTGYSGSPVFIFRTPGYDLETQLTGDKILMAGTNLLMLLGIHYAQFPELWEVTEKGKLLNKETREPLLTEGKYIRGLSGMTCILPAWHILEVLNMPAAKSHRDRFESNLRAQLAVDTKTPIAEHVPSHATDDNPTHREDFNRLLSAAAQKREQED